MIKKNHRIKEIDILYSIGAILAVFGLVKKVLANKNTVCQICVLSVCTLVFGILALYPPFTTGWFGVKDIFQFAFYMPFGMLLAYLNRKKYQSKITPPILPALCSGFLLAVAIICYIFFYNSAFARFVISLLMIFCLLSVAFSLKNTGEKAFNYFSKNIFTVYIYSWPFQSVTIMVLEKLGFGWQICAPITFVVGIIAPIAIITIYNHFRKINCRFFDLVLGIR